MSYQDLAQVIESTNKLTPDEQLQLIAHLALKIRDNDHQTQKRYLWRDVAGFLPSHLRAEQ